MAVNVKLKKLKDQVIVLTGATSGIGLSTARMAAKRGARLVLAARGEADLRQLVSEIRSKGGEAVEVVADVGSEADVRRIAEAARQHFGGFDTWVNNAGVSIYGRLTEISLEDQRRLFETNFWGVVHGSRVAVEHLRKQGGALINIGSTLSDRAIPLQGIYCSSKFAVRGYTDALRMEVEHDDYPISVTLIKPAAIDTPYKQHAKNYMKEDPENPPPVYAPEVVAKAILHCAETPERHVAVGGASKAFTLLEKVAPRTTDKVMEATLFDIQQSGKPARPRTQHALDKPGGGLRERGGYEGHVAESSAYTTASLHPVLTGLAMVGASWALSSLWRSKEQAVETPDYE